MLKVLRREEKYMLPLREAHQNAHYFEALLKLDEHSQGKGYKVRSLYFDTIDDDDFHNKLTEQNIRRKIRLRIYSPSDQFAKLELKQKMNIYQMKRSLVVTKADALELIKGNFSVLLKYKDEFADEMYVLMTEGCYRPKTIIEYWRKAFVAEENNIRITFDSEIRAIEGNFDLYSTCLPLYPVLPMDKVIFEVKYNRFLLSYISDIISSVDKSLITASKYVMGRSISYPFL